MDVFDKIISGEIPSYRIYEDEYCVSFLDIAPIRKGHALVVSKKCVPTIDRLDEEEIAGLFAAVRKVDAKMRDALKCDAINIMVNDGPAAGQEVGHVHVHLIPRFKGDGAFDIAVKEKYAEGEAVRFCETLNLL